jgi:hypothetical protein
VEHDIPLHLGFHSVPVEVFLGVAGTFPVLGQSQETVETMDFPVRENPRQLVDGDPTENAELKDQAGGRLGRRVCKVRGAAAAEQGLGEILLDDIRRFHQSAAVEFRPERDGHPFAGKFLLGLDELPGNRADDFGNGVVHSAYFSGCYSAWQALFGTPGEISISPTLHIVAVWPLPCLPARSHP